MELLCSSPGVETQPNPNLGFNQPTMTSETPSITFYDIALAPPAQETACSPNPWKSRYALNFKSTPYRTTWVPFLDIPNVRGSLNIPPSRTFADGSPYPTLPIISDPSTGRVVGDSFEIALYLQRQYPSSGGGDLFPAQDLGFSFERDLGLFAPVAVTPTSELEDHVAAYVKFNTSVDSVFTAHTQLMVQGLPFDPAVADKCKAVFTARTGVKWDAMGISGEKRDDVLKSFEESLEGLARLFARDESGPFLQGKKASYADFIVGGWLRMSCGMLPPEEWEALKGWHGGVFGRLHEALKEFAQME